MSSHSPIPRRAAMRRRVARWMALAAAVFAGACSDGSPPAPSQPAARPSANTVPAECTEQSAIRRLIVAVHPPGAVDEAQRRFSEINRLYCVRGLQAEGRAAMFGLVRYTLDLLNAGGLNPTPRSSDPSPVPRSTPLAVLELVQRLYAYVGLAGAFTVPPDDFVRAAYDGFIVYADATRPFFGETTSGNMVVQAPTGFFDAPAVVVAARRPDQPFFVPTNQEYPPRYQITVNPITAQTFYLAADGNPSLRANVSICPGDPPSDDHPDESLLRIYRNAEPTSQRASGFLDQAPSLIAPGECNENSPDTPPPGFASASVGRRVLAGAGAALGAVGRWLGPTPLYAWDGGVGGFTFEMSGFVPALPPAPPAAPSIDGAVRIGTANGPAAPAGVTVTLDLGNTQAATNADGNFTMNVAPAFAGQSGSLSTAFSVFDETGQRCYSGSQPVNVPASGSVGVTLVVQEIACIT